jgi:hypothetical protein
MGLFDALDSFLDAVENGAIEKRVTQGLDKVEKTLDDTVKKGERLADASEAIVKKVDTLGEKVDRTVETFQRKAE